MTGILNGKIAVVTGGGSGIGRATARMFAREGAQVMVGDLHAGQGPACPADFSGAIRFQRCDVTREADVAALILATADAYGGLDILINNAGAQGFSGNIEVMPASAWDAVMALVLRGPMFGIKHALPAMRARGGGSIVNIASCSGLPAGLGIPFAPAYAVAKAGLLQLTRVAALEAAPDKIRINAICPGFTATAAFGTGAGLSSAAAEALVPALTDAMAELQPLPRGGTAEDIARSCVFLASAESDFVTGTELVVDGGLMIKPRYDLGAGTPGNVSRLLAGAGAAGNTAPHSGDL